MQRPLFARFGLTFGVIVLFSGFGLYGGFELGRAVALRHTADRLKAAAEQSLKDSVAYSHDSHTVLDGMLASPYAPCSQADLELLRNLLKEAHLLREVGRIHDDRIACSTSYEQQGLSKTKLPAPYSVGADGVLVYRDPPGFTLPHFTVTMLRQGDVYVVLNPYINVLRPRAPEHIVTAVIGPHEKRPFPISKYSARPSMEQFTRDGAYRIGDIQYATRCAAATFTCMTAALSDDEALRLEQPDMETYRVFGVILGGVIGLFLSLEYSRSHSLERQLRRALRKDKLRVVYQPVVELATRKIVGAEALARWTNDNGVEVRPDVFVAVAEQGGFVGEVTRRILQRSLRDLGATLRQHPEFRLSVNVSADDLADAEFLPMLKRCLAEAKVAAESVTIEITESSTARNDVAIDCIRRLRQAGHCVHIDDFGTGYSSLSYLQHLAVDAIKIDRAFTQSIGTGSVTMAILPPILTMADGLGLQIVVEGIETGEQAEYFGAKRPAILGQGYLFGRPMIAPEFLRALAEQDEQSASRPALEACGTRADKADLVKAADASPAEPV